MHMALLFLQNYPRSWPPFTYVVLCHAAQVVIKLAEADMSPSTLSALRFSIAALCFAPAALRGMQNRDLRASALELGAWLFGGSLVSAAAADGTGYCSPSLPG